MLNKFLIIRVFTIFILPYIFLYALYLQVNGETSPGGGFQAGVIFASALVGMDLISPSELLRKKLSIKALTFIATLGLIIYAGVGLISFLSNDNYLNYYALASNKLSAQSTGIFLVEIGVGLTVSAIMCLIYLLFNHADEY